MITVEPEHTLTIPEKIVYRKSGEDKKFRWIFTQITMCYPCAKMEFFFDGTHLHVHSMLCKYLVPYTEKQYKIFKLFLMDFNAFENTVKQAMINEEKAMRLQQAIMSCEDTEKQAKALHLFCSAFDTETVDLIRAYEQLYIQMYDKAFDEEIVIGDDWYKKIRFNKLFGSREPLKYINYSKTEKQKQSGVNVMVISKDSQQRAIDFLRAYMKLDVSNIRYISFAAGNFDVNILQNEKFPDEVRKIVIKSTHKYWRAFNLFMSKP
jgi:hypothetical protein